MVSKGKKVWHDQANAGFYQKGYEVKYIPIGEECKGGTIVLVQYIDGKVDSFAKERTDEKGHRRVPAYTDEGPDARSGLQGTTRGSDSYIDAPSNTFLEIFKNPVVTMRVEAFCRCPDADDYFLASTQFSFDYETREVKPIGAGKKKENKITAPGNDEKITFVQEQTYRGQ